MEGNFYGEDYSGHRRHGGGRQQEKSVPVLHTFRCNETYGEVLIILAAGFVILILPYLLSFAAGAMIYVVVEELIPERSEGKHSDLRKVLFDAGFTVMMALDVALG